MGPKADAHEVASAGGALDKAEIVPVKVFEIAPEPVPSQGWGAIADMMEPPNSDCVKLSIAYL